MAAGYLPRRATISARPSAGFHSCASTPLYSCLGLGRPSSVWYRGLRGSPAVTTKKRFAPLPNVPTIAETVVPEFDVLAWYALAGPKKLPAPVLARLNEAALAALKRPDVTDRLHAQGAEPWGTTPREAQAFLAGDVARWTKTIRDEKIPQQE